MVVRSLRRFAPRDDISRGLSLRMPCNEADAARSACPNGQKMAIEIENINKKNPHIMVIVKNLAYRSNKINNKNIAVFL